MIGRRSFLAGILAAGAAPAIVKAESLMKGPRITVWKSRSVGLSTTALYSGEIGVIDAGFRFIVVPQLRRTAPVLVAPLIHGSPVTGISFARHSGGPIFVPSTQLHDLLSGDRKTA